MTLILMQHQIQARNIGRERKRFGFYWDCGCGKSIAILSIVNDGKQRGEHLKTLVLAPKSIMRPAWLTDAKYFPDLNVVVCWDNSPSKRKALINSNADILIINPSLFTKHAKDFYEAGVRRLVIDESSAIKNVKAQVTKTAIAFSDLMTSVYLLSGSPAPNGEIEYFSQLRCLNKNLVGNSFWTFAGRYFFPQKKFIRGKEVTIGWTIKETEKDKFFAILRSASWSLKKHEAVDLPPQTDVTREFELNEEELEVYQAIEKQLVNEVATNQGVIDCETNNVLMRLRQSTGGQLKDQPVFGSSKMLALCETLEEIGDKQCVIWATFSAEIHRIKYELGSKAEIIDGSVPLPERERRIADFQAGRIQYLICQVQTCAHGVTLTAASYSVNYSLSFSYELYEQARNRIHRVGQKWPCTHITLIAKDTCDEKVYWAVRTKQRSADVVAAILAQAKESVPS